MPTTTSSSRFRSAARAAGITWKPIRSAAGCTSAMKIMSWSSTWIRSKLSVTSPTPPARGGGALSRELNRVFAANGDEDAVGVFELSPLEPIAKWKATGRRPNQIAYEPMTQRVFSFNSTGRNITVFDAKTGNVLSTIEVDGRTEFYAVDGKGMIYDSLQDKATIIAIDAKM